MLTTLFGYAGGGALRLPLGQSIYPEDLLGVKVSDGIAQINLSASFYRACQSLGERDEHNLVYAMVNTLCELEEIRAVRFYVEGQAADTLGRSIYLKSPLLPNPGIVVVPETATEAPLATEPPLATAVP